MSVLVTKIKEEPLTDPEINYRAQFNVKIAKFLSSLTLYPWKPVCIYIYIYIKWHWPCPKSHLGTSWQIPAELWQDYACVCNLAEFQPCSLGFSIRDMLRDLRLVFLVLNVPENMSCSVLQKLHFLCLSSYHILKKSAWLLLADGFIAWLTNFAAIKKWGRISFLSGWLTRELVESRSLEIFRKCLDTILYNVF